MTSTTTVTVLFTDVVGNTALRQRLGDAAAERALQEHNKIVRDQIGPCGGREVKTMGDGFMASFGSATKAVECAVALQRAFNDRDGEPLSVRVGLNDGGVKRDGIGAGQAPGRGATHPHEHPSQPVEHSAHEQIRVSAVTSRAIA